MLSWIGGDAASQQTYFIVSGSPSNIMLGGGNQNTVLGKIKSCGIDAALQQTYFIVSGSPSNTMLGGGVQVDQKQPPSRILLYTR